MNTQVSFPNKEVENLWSGIYKDIQTEVKEPETLEIPFEKRIREVLKKHLGTELIRTDAGYKEFFYDVIRFAVDMHTDKILSKIEAGRSKYGEARHSKGRISDEFLGDDEK